MALIVKPEYVSTTRIYVVNLDQGDKSGLTNQVLQAGSYLVKDYREIILSQNVLVRSGDKFDVGYTSRDVSWKVQVTVLVDLIDCLSFCQG